VEADSDEATDVNGNDALRAGLVEALQQFDRAAFVTLMFNQEVDLRLAARPVVDFFNRVQRRAHGSRWRTFPRDQQLRAYAFPEHPHSNLHWHCVVTGSDRIMECLLSNGASLWAERAGRGHADVQLVQSMAAVARYVTKYALADWSIENFIAYAPDPA
jgi:hypothetical protein